MPKGSRIARHRSTSSGYSVTAVQDVTFRQASARGLCVSLSPSDPGEVGPIAALLLGRPPGRPGRRPQTSVPQLKLIQASSALSRSGSVSPGSDFGGPATSAPMVLAAAPLRSSRTPA